MSSNDFVHGLALRSTANRTYTFKVLDLDIIPEGDEFEIVVCGEADEEHHVIRNSDGVTGKPFALSGIVSSHLNKNNISSVKVSYLEELEMISLDAKDKSGKKIGEVTKPEATVSLEKATSITEEVVQPVIEREPIVSTKRKDPELKPKKIQNSTASGLAAVIEEKIGLKPMSITGTDFKYLSYSHDVLPEGYDEGDLTLTMVDTKTFRLVKVVDGKIETSGKEFTFDTSDVHPDGFDTFLSSLPMEETIVNVDVIIDKDLRLPVITFQALLRAPEAPLDDLDDIEEDFPVVEEAEEEVIPETDVVEEVPVLEERPRHFVEVAGESEVTVATDDIIPEATLLSSSVGYPEEEGSVVVAGTRYPETNVVLEEGLDVPEGYDISKAIDPNSIMVDGVFLSDMSFEDFVKVLREGVTIEDVDSGFSATVEWDEEDEDVISEGEFHTGGSLSETGVSLATPVDVKIVNDAVLEYGLPSYATEGSAGLDLRIVSITEPYTLQPGEVLKASTGLAVYLESPMMVGKIYPRSGLSSKHGIALANTVGIVDSDYQGEVLIMLKNFSNEPYTLNPGDRVAQMVVTIIDQVDLNIVSTFSNETVRGDGALGSTGKD